MTSTATPASDSSDIPPAAVLASASVPSTSASSSSSLSFASLLSPSTSSLGGTIGSTAHPDRITPMAPINSSAASAASSNDSSATAALPFDVRGFIESVRQKQLHRRIRPVAAFFDPTRFSRPTSTTEATARIDLNLQWFYVNYIAIAALILLLTIMSQPSFLLTLLVLAAVWLFALTREVVVVPYTPYSLTGRSKLVTMYGVTAVTLLVFAGTTILTVVGVCGLVVLGHAALHNTPTQEERDGDEQLDSITMV